MSRHTHAIVVGASIGGLTAARALADHFERVVVLDADALPGAATQRAGTPQARHVHALLGGGQRALEDLFPGFTGDLAAAEAVPYRAGFDLIIERPGYDPLPQRDLGWTGYSMSRPLIECLVRRRVAAFANITIRPRCRARELVPSADNTAIAGVRCDVDGRDEILPADLVVDASGRGALTLALLDSIGLKADESFIGINYVYATAIFDVPDDAPRDWKGVLTFPLAPENSRFASMLPIEGRRWMLSAGGAHGDTPPADPDGYLEFVRGLRTPTIYNAVRQARRVGDIQRFGFPASVRRHFERLDAFPRGLVPIADAICRFNPTYGQGMSVAAAEACALGRVLATRRADADPLDGLAGTFFAAAQPLIDAPWAAVTTDFVYPQTEGQRPPDFEQSLKFGAALTALAVEDPAVHKLLVEVQHLLTPRSALRDPALVERVRGMMAEA